MTPLVFPATGASLQTFEPEFVDYSAPEAGGALGGVSAGAPRWRGVWTIGKVGEARSDQWRAFDARLGGQKRPFYARDLRRPFPKAHKAGFAGMVRAGTSDPFGGAALDWSEAITADNETELTLEGLPASILELSVGDYVGFSWTTSLEPRRALVRVTIGATSNGSGEITVTVTPNVPGVVPPGAVAYLNEPSCIMRKMTAESSLQPIDRTGGIRGGTFVALQDLRP